MSGRLVHSGSEQHEVAATFERGTLRLGGVSGEEHEAVALGGGAWRLTAPDGCVRLAFVARRRTTWWMHVDGRTFVLESVVSARGAAAGSLAAPMTGKVLELLVREGDRVKAGQALVVLSAMKMQVEVKSPVDGTVRTLPHGVGEQVEGGTQLATVEADEKPVRAP